MKSNQTLQAQSPSSWGSSGTTGSGPSSGGTVPTPAGTAATAASDAGADLIARYLHEVGRQLPRGERQDVQRELRSLLDETLADQAADAGGPADEAAVAAVLRDMGAPVEVAERYGQARPHLIGPTTYPAFATTLRVVLAITAIVHIVGFALSLASPDRVEANAISALAGMLASLGGSVLINVGLLAILFAVIERVSPSRATTQATEWDPASLPPIVDSDRLNIGEGVFEVVADALGLAFYNRLAGWDVPFILPGAGLPWVRLAPSVLALTPWINLIWIAEIGVSLWVLAHGRWSMLSRAAVLLTSVGSVVLLTIILTQGPILMDPRLDRVVQFGMAVTLAIVGVDTLQQAIRLGRSIVARAS